ncbi:glycerol kinase [Condylostylus longicornis]|uniref:glycerol kinase n=1 Tax=Condylostylus longicornis TaxID=2530218 RepID=UPI00244DB414|nr:glycerol kinase [Condylostylus longicornis]
MDSFGRFGPLIGVISIGNTYCKFLVYAAKNAEILTCHEIRIKQISQNTGWLEFDPLEIWANVNECIEISSKNLKILDINPLDIVAVGICNQRGTTVLWHSKTGLPFYNAIAWSDSRTNTILKNILDKLKGKQNYLKSVCGLPLSTCFSALKILWLKENFTVVSKALTEKECFFGTLDSWIIWNLTGGKNGGIHITDITNAAYTMLMNIETLKWDRNLCEFFGIPQTILPNIRSCSEIYAYIHDGELRGTPIASSIGDQPAALLGQLGLRVGQTSCAIDDCCHVLINTGQEIIDSENGLLTTVAFKLGKENVCYALEGAIANAGGSINWLKEKLEINTEINQNDTTAEVLSNFLGDSSMMSSSNSSVIFSNTDTANAFRKSEVLFVPAFNGLYSPYWRHDAKGLILGISGNTTSEHITQAAYESTGFQIRDILEAIKKDTPTWPKTRRLTVSGEFSENNNFMQFIADIIGIGLDRPQTASASCLGVMLAAGRAMDILSLENAHFLYTPPSDLFFPTTTANRREILYQRWHYAVKKCISWDNFENYENEIQIFTQREKDPDANVRRSIPGSLFITTSFALLLVARYLKNLNIN